MCNRLNLFKSDVVFLRYMQYHGSKLPIWVGMQHGKRTVFWLVFSLWYGTRMSDCNISLHRDLSVSTGDFANSDPHTKSNSDANAESNTDAYTNSYATVCAWMLWSMRHHRRILQFNNRLSCTKNMHTSRVHKFFLVFLWYMQYNSSKLSAWMELQCGKQPVLWLALFVCHQCRLSDCNVSLHRNLSSSTGSVAHSGASAFAQSCAGSLPCTSPAYVLFAGI